MESDALDMAVARYARQAGMITAEQLATALQEQAKTAFGGSPSSLADALLKLGYITDAQRKMVEEKAQGKQAVVQQLLHYRLVRKIGEGGMGTVYLSEDTKAGRKVALKVLPKHLSSNVELVKRFRREAQAAIRLDHPNIVRGFEVGEDLGFHFYAMEYCEGQALDRLLAVENRLPVDRALGLALQVARGLKFAHGSGLIHRDIKPANVFLSSDGRARILDLGLSKNLEGSQSTFHTVTGAVMGTPHYISPEQANGERNIDGRTDLYSLGATLYHMLTGEAPFPGSSAMEVMYKHVHDQLPDPREKVADLSERVVELLKRLMAKAPADRHRDAAQLIEDLEEVIAGRSPKTAGIDPAKSTIAPLRVAGARPVTARIKKVSTVRRTVVVQRRSNTPLVAGIAAAAVAVIGVFALWPKGKPEPVPAPPPPVVRKTSEPPASTPPVPPPAAKDPWAAAVDLLPLVDPARDAVEGRWTRSGGEVHSADGGLSKAIVPYAPPEEYDVRLTFTPGGATPDLNLLLTASRRTFQFLIGGFKNSVVGAGFDNGDLRVEAVVPRLVRPQGFLKTGTRHALIVRVRRDRLSAELDGQTVVDAKVDYSRLSCAGHLALPDGAPMGLLSSGCPTRFHRLELVAVTGRGSPWTPAARPPPPLVPPTTAGRDLLALVDPARDGYRGTWSLRNGALTSDRSEPALLAIPYEPPAEYDLSVEFSRKEGACSTMILASRRGRTFGVTLGDVGNSIAGFARMGEEGIDTNASRTKLSLYDDRRYTVQVQVRESRIAVLLDGVALLGWDPSQPELGVPRDWTLPADGLPGVGSCESLTTFHKVELAERSGAGRVVTVLGPPRAADLRPWRKLFDGKSLNWLSKEGAGAWKVEAGAMVRTPGGREAAQTVETFADGELRVRFEVAPETEYVGIAVRQGEAGKDSAGFDRPTLSPLAARTLEVLVGFAGPEVRATLNGKPVRVLREGKASHGHVQITAVGPGLRILAVDFRASEAPAEPVEQARAVIRKLRELNPGLEGEPTYEVQGGQVVSFTLFTGNVTDLSPLKALGGLKKLRARGSWVEATREYKPGSLVSLESLRGTALAELDVGINAIADLSPLRGMQLQKLALASNPVKSLAPLSGMPLLSLDIGGTAVADLKPLEGMKLEGLSAWDTPVQDLSPLRGMPLSVLNLRNTPIRSIEVLRGMKLTWLTLHGCAVADLSPLRDMVFSEYFGPVDRDVARTWKYIEKINDKPAAEALK